MTDPHIQELLNQVALNHIPRSSGSKKIPRMERMEMYDRKCIALYKLSKYFSLSDEQLKSLFEVYTNTRIEMWKLRNYLYTGFRLTCEQETPPKWVVDVAKNAN